MIPINAYTVPDSISNTPATDSAGVIVGVIGSVSLLSIIIDEIFVSAGIVDVGRRDVVKDDGGCVDNASAVEGTCVDWPPCIELISELFEGAGGEDCTLCEGRMLPWRGSTLPEAAPMAAKAMNTHPQDLCQSIMGLVGNRLAWQPSQSIVL